jgi:hypothetical protein
MKKVLLLIILFFLPTCGLSVDITNSQLVEEMEVEIIESGRIYISGKIFEISLNLSIPQDDDYQKLELLEVYDSGLPCRGSCTKSFLFDKFGNRLLNIKWENPTKDIDFKVKSIVSVRRRINAKGERKPEFLMPTSLVQSTDSEVAEIASRARGSDFERVSYLVKWINENIEYDRVYSNVNLSAKEILAKRRGVCDEISNLLVSFLRNLGYYSSVALGYVYPGEVYGGDEFQPHGWVEIYSGDGIIADPTWGEVGFLDATHIKFTTSPDSIWVFNKMNAKGFGDFKVVLSDIKTDIRVLEFKESPLIDVDSTLLEENLWSGYAIVKTDLYSDRCILTKIISKSCIDESGKEFLKVLKPESIVYFCNNKTIFSIFELPKNLDPLKVYSCPISIKPYAGEQKTLLLKLSQRGLGKVELVVDKTMVSPGEKVRAESKGSYIFTDFGYFGYDRAEIEAPYYDFIIYAYNSGSLTRQDIKVVSMKPFDVNIFLNQTVHLGETVPIIVEVKNNLDEAQSIEIRLREETRRMILKDMKNFTFYFTPQNEMDNLIQVFISSGDFSTSVSKKLTILRKENIFSSIVEALVEFLRDIYNAIMSIFSFR